MSNSPIPEPVADPSDTTSKGRIATLIESARTRASATAENLRDRSTVFDSFYRMWKHDTEVGGGLMAGALAFRLFLFLMPFVLFMLTALGTASEVAKRSSTDLASSVGISGLLAKGVANTASFTSGQKWTILFVSGYALIVASRSLVKTLVTSVCLAWKMPQVKMKSTSAGLLFIAYFAVTTFLTTWIDRLQSSAPAPGTALLIVWLAIPFLSILWLMAKLPHKNAPVWALIPGAMVTSIGFEVMHMFTVFWIAPSATSKTETYGVIGLSLATLAWCYLAGRLVVGSTVLNAALWKRHEENNPGLILSTIEPGAKLIQRIRTWLSSTLDLFR